MRSGFGFGCGEEASYGGDGVWLGDDGSFELSCFMPGVLPGPELHSHPIAFRKAGNWLPIDCTILPWI